MAGDETYAIRITGYGNTAASATDKRFWLCTQPLRSDPDSLCKPLLMALPKEVGFEVGLRSGEVSGGELTFTLGGPDDILDPVAGVLCRYGPRPISARFAQDADPTDTTLFLDTSGLGGLTRHAGLEALTLGTEVGTTGEYTGCTRAQLKTIARHHPGDLGVLYSISPVIEGRVIELIVCPTRGTYADAVVLWTGMVSRIKRQGHSIKVEALSALHRIREGSLLGQQYRTEVLTTGVETDEPPIGGYPTYTPSGQPFAGTNSDKRVVLANEKGLVWIADWVGGDDGSGTTISEVLYDPGGERLGGEGTVCWEVFCTHPSAPAITRRYDRAVGFKLPSNPIRFVQAILTSTDNGTNGAWDLGRRHLGLGFETEALDLDSFNRWAARTEDVVMSEMVLGREGKPEDTHAVIRRALAPLHLGLTMNAQGLAVWGWLDALPYAGAAVVIGLAQHHKQPGELDLNGAAAVDEVEFSYGTSYGGARRQAVIDVVEAQPLHPHSPSQRIEVDASAYGPNPLSQWAANIAEAYRFPSPILTIQVPQAVAAAWPGDLVDYSNPNVGAPDGSRGVQNVPALVVGRTGIRGPGGDHDTLRLDLAFTGTGLTKVAHIANSVRVSSYTAPGASVSGHHEVVVEKGYFKDDGSQPLSPDSQPFDPLDVVRFCDGDLVPYELAVTLKSITRPGTGFTDTLIVDASHTFSRAPVAGDIVRHGPHGVVAADVRETFAFWAPSSGDFTTLPLLDRAPYQYPLDASTYEGDTPGQSWRKFGAGSLNSEDPVDEAVLMRLAANVADHVARRLPSASTIYSETRLPRLFGGVVDMGLLTCWYLHPGVDEVRVELLLTGYVADVSLRAVAMTQGGQVALSTSVVMSPGSDAVELVCDTSGLPRGFTVIAIRAASEQDAASFVGVSATYVQGIGVSRRYIRAGNGGSWPSPGLTADVPYILNAGDDLSGATPPGQQVYPDRLVIAHSVGSLTDPTDEQYWVWPVWSENAAATYASHVALGSHSDLIFTPLGYVEVHSIAIESTSCSQAGPAPREYRAGLEPAARTIRRIQADMEWLQRNRVPVLHAGPGWVEVDASVPFASRLTPSGAVIPDPSYYARLFSGKEAEVSVWSCTVGDDKWPSYLESDGTTVNYQPTLVIEGVVGCHYVDVDLDTITVRLRAEVNDFSDTPGTEVVGVAVDVEVPVMGLAETGRVTDGVAELTVFSTELSQEDRRFHADHAARGLWPMEQGGRDLGLRDLGLVRFRVEVTDTSPALSPALRRRLSVYAVPVEVEQEHGDLPWVVVPCAEAYIKPTPTS